MCAASCRSCARDGAAINTAAAVTDSLTLFFIILLCWEEFMCAVISKRRPRLLMPPLQFKRSRHCGGGVGATMVPVAPPLRWQHHRHYGGSGAATAVAAAGASSVLVRMPFLLMPGMNVIMLAMLPFVIMLMRSLRNGMIMRMLVLVLVRMSVLVAVLMSMFRLVSVLVLMLVLMRMLMLVLMLVLVTSFHSALLAKKIDSS
jgi:hypothetical protein